MFGSIVGIPAPNDTRWNSTLRQVQALVTKSLADINKVCRASGHPECVFLNKDFDMLKELCNLLEPFRALTDQLQGDKVIILQLA